MRFEVLDFETRSDVELTTHGLDNYSNSPEFDAIICATMTLSTGEVQWSEMPEGVKAHMYPLIKDPGIQFIAHNAMFEYQVCSVLAKRWGLPQPALSRFHCTSAQALALGFPAALDKVAKILFKEQKQANGKTLINIFGKKHGKKHHQAFYSPADKPAEWNSFVTYCIQDIKLTAKVWQTLPQLSDESRRYWLSVGRMNLRGFRLNIRAIDTVLTDIEMIKADANAVIKAITKGFADKSTQGARIKTWMAEQGYTTESLSAEQVRLWLSDPDLPEDIWELLTARMKGSKSTFGKYLAFRRFASKDWRNRHGFWFWGAHTGRLSGKGSQPQNIAYDKTGNITIDGKPASPDAVLDLYLMGLLPKEWDKSEALIAMIRAMIESPPGKLLYIVDQSAIEARIVCWLAGHEEFLEMYRRNEDLYKPMAAYILGKSVTLVSKEERNKYGKPGILGCGYGMGEELLSKKYNLDIRDARRIKQAYKKKYFKVPKYWDRLQDAFRLCMTLKKPMMAGKVLFRYETIGGINFVCCTPPGGRHIWYRDPKIDKKGQITCEREGYTNTYRAKLWGGTLLENIAQNIAGYILAHGTFNVEVLLALPVLQIHDELVCEVEPDANIAALDAAMIRVPRLEGLPLAVESKLEKRFTKG